MTKSTCTHHFKVLREAGIIHQRQQGTARLNALREEDLEARFPGLLQHHPQRRRRPMSFSRRAGSVVL